MITLTTIADVRAACDAARAAGGRRRVRADDGLLPRRPPVADARRACSRRLRRRQPVREPARSSGRPRTSSAYPRDPDGDAAVAEAEGVDVLFTPTVDEMYPAGAAHHRPRRRAHRAGCAAASRPRPLRRRHHRGREAVLDRRAVPRLLRPQGRPAARGRPPHGRRPRPAGRGGGLPARARARRTGDVEPQRRTSTPTAASAATDAVRRAVHGVGGGGPTASATPPRSADSSSTPSRTEPQVRLDYVEVVDAATLEPIDADRRPTRWSHWPRSWARLG